MTVINLNDIKQSEVRRITTEISDLDWIYGSSMLFNPMTQRDIPIEGLPYGGLSLWGGSAGVGKTRVCVQVCKNIVSRHGDLDMYGQFKNRKILYFQLEMTLSQFKQKIDGFPANKPWICSDDKKLDAQIAIIKQEKPRLIVVDSVNKIREYRNGYGTDEIEEKYRAAIEPLGAHVIFITHLNEEGDIKGGTNLPHMVDSVVFLKRVETVDYILLKMSDTKHRFGVGGRWMWLRHTDKGVEPITENYRTNGTEVFIKDQGKLSEIMAITNAEAAAKEELQAKVDAAKAEIDARNSAEIAIDNRIDSLQLQVQADQYARSLGGNWLQRLLGIAPPLR